MAFAPRYRTKALKYFRRAELQEAKSNDLMFCRTAAPNAEPPNQQMQWAQQTP